jgi:hypothetical protein
MLRLICHAPTDVDDDDDAEVRVCQSACEVLRVLASDDATRIVIIDGDGVTTLGSAMWERADFASLQAAGCDALEAIAPALCDASVVMRPSVGFKMVRVILAAMRNQRSSEPVQRSGCDALQTILQRASTRAVAAAVRGADGVWNVLSAMRRYPNTASVQRAGCGILAAFASTCVEYASEVIAAGGFDVVLSAMQRHSEPEMQERGRSVLASLSIGGGTAEAQPLPLAGVGADGIDAVLSLMRLYPESSSVQELGCRGLLFQCTSITDGVDKVVTGCGIDVVLAAMRRHPDSALVQSQGCGVLQSIAQRGSSHRRAVRLVAKSTIVAAGGIDVVMSAMRRHRARVDVQALGCGALCSFALAEGSFRNSDVIGAAGAVDVVTAAMALHPDSAAVQRHGCAALRVMLERYDGSRAELVAADGVSLVVSAMRCHEEVSVASFWLGREPPPANEGGTYEGVCDLVLDVIAPHHGHFPGTGEPCLRHSWLNACDVIGREVPVAVVEPTLEAAPTLMTRTPTGATAGASTAALVVSTALADRVRVSFAGEPSTRPRGCLWLMLLSFCLLRSKVVRLRLPVSLESFEYICKPSRHLADSHRRTATAAQLPRRSHYKIARVFFQARHETATCTRGRLASCCGSA